MQSILTYTLTPRHYVSGGQLLDLLDTCQLDSPRCMHVCTEHYSLTRHCCCTANRPIGNASYQLNSDYITLISCTLRHFTLHVPFWFKPSTTTAVCLLPTASLDAKSTSLQVQGPDSTL
jgi:hypothetical protein